MDDIPKNIEIEKLPGSRVNGSRTMYFRDQIIYSPNKEYFALAYSINEVSNGNEVGFLSWGKMHGGDADIFELPMKVFVSCWRSPWCKWISNDTFAFKAQRYFNNKVNIPIVILNVNRGFAILPESNEPNSWFEDQVITDLDYTACTDIELFNKVINS